MCGEGHHAGNTILDGTENDLNYYNERDIIDSKYTHKAESQHVVFVEYLKYLRFFSGDLGINN